MSPTYLTEPEFMEVIADQLRILYSGVLDAPPSKPVLIGVYYQLRIKSWLFAAHK